MAIVGDAMCDMRTAVTPYVSSNAYYGYVPTYARDNHAIHTRNVHNGSAMETDEELDGSSSHLNNRSMIPEASSSSWWCRDATTNQYLDNRQMHRGQDTERMERFRNRKRSNGDHGTDRHAKRPREGYTLLRLRELMAILDTVNQLVDEPSGFPFRDGGNGRIYYGTGSPMYNRSTEVHEGTLLRLDTISCNIADGRSFAFGGCCWAAGNHSLISNPDCKGLLSRNVTESHEDGIEYERMLFETHGCSAYQHCRQQQMETDTIETEF